MCVRWAWNGMKMNLFMCFLYTTFFFRIYAQNDTCKEVEGAKWKCRLARDCGGLSELSQGKCGRQGEDQLFCCPSTSNENSYKSKANSYCERVVYAGCGEATPGWWVGPLPGGRPEAMTPPPPVAGGLRAQPKEFPSMALIGFGNEKEKVWLCGGTLISERFVLGAAHCINQYRLGVARWVRLGDLDYSSTEEPSDPQDFRIKRRIAHPGYREPSLYHDIALFELQGRARFTHYVKPLCLHSSATVPVSSVLAAGWGRTGVAEDVSTWLMKEEIWMIKSSTCSNFRTVSSYIPEGVNASTMLCAGRMEGGKDTCQGDSGGPLLVRLGGRCAHTQVGVTSFGGLCALPDSPAVYTRVSYYLPWIESIVWS